MVLTPSREQCDLVESHQVGVNRYIVKPVDFEQYGITEGGFMSSAFFRGQASVSFICIEKEGFFILRAAR